MSIHRKLTKKYLIHNKKRTIFTILGIMMSIALTTSIGTFLFSLQNYTIEQTKSDYGSYHLKIKNADSQTKKRLQANPQIDKIGVLSKETFFIDSGRQIEMNYINQDTYTLLPFNPVSNRKQQGLIIEEWVAADLEKMDYMNLPLMLNDASGMKHSFHVQKIVENKKALRDGQTLQAFLVQKAVKKDRDIDLYIELAQEANFQVVYDQIQAYIPKENIEINHPLVGVEYSINNSLFTIIYIFPIFIVVLATVAFIFNTFQISIAERIRDITLLRTVGATKNQIKKMIAYEMWIFGGIGIPLGLLLGFFGYWIVLVLYQLIFEETEFSLFYFPIIFSPVIMLLSSLIGVISLIISGWVPLKMANRIEPLDSIRRSNRTVFKVKRFFRFIERVLSIETIMALRNIRRNKLKSIIVIFSLSISIFLFTAFSNIVLMLFQSDMDNSNGDFTIIFYQSEEIPATFWKDLNQIPEIREKQIHYAGESAPSQSSISNISIYLKDENEVDKVQKKLDQITAHYPNLEVVNVHENMKDQSSLQVQILIYLYGFVIAIAIIGVLNIINTSSMNVILRKKEYATLKAIGMSLKNLRKMIIREGLLYAFISGFIGISLAVSIEFLLYLSSGISNWERSFIQNIAAFMSLIIICYLSARVSARTLTNKDWNDALRDE
ncbi:ABC transporter permease [Bacillus sp. FJAT-49705]|uniref:ABC transporter permease n=1 Tax=Cytobacillus citreus TaxID=2833586 RepID=A0ABS5NRW4_9BACI|nr:ABC transporter permease [Cytobacillus citreus]MBS4190556.1 ABC transporter permease [Cytobacillus citreus]